MAMKKEDGELSICVKHKITPKYKKSLKKGARKNKK